MCPVKRVLSVDRANSTCGRETKQDIQSPINRHHQLGKTLKYENYSGHCPSTFLHCCCYSWGLGKCFIHYRG